MRTAGEAARLPVWLEDALAGWLGSGLLFLALYFSGLPGLYVFFPLAMATSFAGRFRFPALAIVNLVFLIFFDISFWQRWTLRSLFLDEAHPATHLQLMGVKCAALVLLFGIFWALSGLHRSTRFRYVFSFNFLAFLGVLGAFQFLPPKAWFIFLTLKALVIFFSRFFWMLTFTHLTLSAKAKTALTDFACSLPFWNSFSPWHIGAIPRGMGELRACLCSTPAEMRKARLSGLKLIGISWIFLRLTSVGNYLIFLSGGPAYWAQLGIHQFNLLRLPTHSLWAFQITTGIQFMIENIRLLTLIVGLVRFSGFQIPPAIFDVFRSRSFGDFIRHIYYYYSETLCYFFLPGSWNIVRRLPISRRAQNGLTSFLILFVGGILLHFISEVQYGLDTTSLYWMQVAKFAPYLFSLALFAGISAYLQRPQVPGRLRIGAALLYFMLYFICRIFLLWFLEGQSPPVISATLQDYLQYLAAHFGY